MERHKYTSKMKKKKKNLCTDLQGGGVYAMLSLWIKIE